MGMIPTARLRSNSVFSWLKARPRTTTLGALIAAGAGAFLWFVVWVATPRYVDVTIHDISWMHITHLREREIRHSAEWYHQSTKGFYKEPVFNQSCTRRYHYTNTYVCGSYTVSCGDNCSTTVYIYCSDDVYDDWCSYDYYEWPVRDTQQLIGWTHDTQWGEFNLKENQRQQKIASYEVNFTSSDDSWQYKPSTLNDFRRFFKGEHWRLTVGRIRRHNIEEMVKQ
jgi:hypothetical protein